MSRPSISANSAKSSPTCANCRPRGRGATSPAQPAMSARRPFSGLLPHKRGAHVAERVAESVRKTFKEKLRPTPAQERELEAVLWRCRTLYNTA